jgi:hypothetical protein
MSGTKGILYPESGIRRRLRAPTRCDIYKEVCTRYGLGGHCAARDTGVAAANKLKSRPHLVSSQTEPADGQWRWRLARTAAVGCSMFAADRRVYPPLHIYRIHMTCCSSATGRVSKAKNKSATCGQDSHLSAAHGMENDSASRAASTVNSNVLLACMLVFLSVP